MLRGVRVYEGDDEDSLEAHGVDCEGQGSHPWLRERRARGNHSEVLGSIIALEIIVSRDGCSRVPIVRSLACRPLKLL